MCICIYAFSPSDTSVQWNFTIPRTTPPGHYLIRWESIFPNTQDAQFYVNCAHVRIVNEGVAVEPEGKYLVKIPGVYVRGQKGELELSSLSFSLSFLFFVCFVFWLEVRVWGLG